MKVQKQNITSFAGISFVNEEFDRAGIYELTDNHLLTRSFSGYPYSDIFRSWFSIFFRGGDVAEDTQCHLRDALTSIPGNRVASADTLPRGIKQLAVDNHTATSASGKEYQFNGNQRMNEPNIKPLLLTGQLQAAQSHDLDYDNQIIEHEKYDAERTYKKNTGYNLVFNSPFIRIKFKSEY